MKFYNRETERALLQALTQRSARFSQFTAIFGRRRVGKTELVRQHLQNRGLYFFVEKRPSNALLSEFSATLKSQRAHAPAFTNWKDFFVFLFVETQRQPAIVVFDEFQNFLAVDPSVYSILQGVWDDWHKPAKIHLIAIGSVVGLMKKVFQDAKEPLYGRLTQEIDLVALNPETRQTLFVECKWTSMPVGTGVLTALKQRAQNLHTDQAFYLIASKSGFTPALKNHRDPHLYLWDLNDIATFLTENSQASLGGPL